MKRRECSKCGSGAVMVDYRAQTNDLACSCASCNYTWTETPDDEKREDEKQFTITRERRPFPWLPLFGAGVALIGIIFGLVLLLSAQGGHS